MGTKNLEKKLIYIYSQKVAISQKGQNICVLISMSHKFWEVNFFCLKF